MGISQTETNPEGGGQTDIVRDTDAEMPAGSGQGTEASDRRGVFSRMCCLTDDKESPSSLRHLYGAYTLRTRRESASIFVLLSLVASLRSLLASSVAYGVNGYVIANADGNDVTPKFLAHILVSATFIIADVIAFVIQATNKKTDRLLKAALYFAYVTMTLQYVMDWLLGQQTKLLLDYLEFSLVLVFVALSLAPFYLRQCLLLAFVAIASHLVTSSAVVQTDGGSGNNYPWTLLLAQVCLYCSAVVLGLVTQHLINGAVRESFVQSKESLLITIQIEEDRQEQERLLLSVLPKHVADQMLKDMDNTNVGQFRRIYMNRHENVSIMFADIVGFTALSSSVTPTELVKILNDMFATFDKLAKKYNQLRIKILGDCYYCICGCPTPRQDHAVLTIYMGLAVIETIRRVSVRVGIHSGSVLGGVLGQVRWQYDVFGREVTMANRMESGGLPGRVHISEVTARYLDNQFELEPGLGDQRDEHIKMAGIKTYLVKRVLVPYEEETSNNDKAVDVSKKTGNKENDQLSKPLTNTEKLEQTLMDREENTDISRQLSPVTLHFLDKKMEDSFYSNTRRTNCWLNIVSMAVVTWLATIATLITNGVTKYSATSLILGAVVLTMLSLLAYLSSKYKTGPMSTFGRHIGQTQLGQIMWALFCSGALLASHLISGLGCTDVVELPTTADSNVTTVGQLPAGCTNPQLFAYVSILVQLCVTSLNDVEYLVKSAINIIIAIGYCLLHVIIMAKSYDVMSVLATAGRPLFELSLKHDVIIITLLMTIACLIINRHFELLSRKLHFYKTKMADLKNHSECLKAKNELLVYNILPAHVAKHFIGVKREDEELYSQGYDEAGVMFASCPNFTDFYSEDRINKDGLECIRLLNEILSDFDDILTQPAFSEITKIKTIGPTYMAVSGINKERQANESDDVTTRWQHLADLVEFIFAMKECLRKINEQSFNHFMLRVGLNHGPILAGVIGAKKPHYDIWGNTVNVASRMDSTGQLGKIQVIEPTMELLTQFGYTFEKRGLIKVKGKGDLVTYFLTGKHDMQHSGGCDVTLPHQVE